MHITIAKCNLILKLQAPLWIPRKMPYHSNFQNNIYFESHKEVCIYNFIHVSDHNTDCNAAINKTYCKPQKVSF